jgi:hypothetical protein
MTRTAATTLKIALLAILTSLNTASAADTNHAKPVIELFTSQGCSSCPPADKLLAKLAKRDDIIALSYNVDYWDYLGWKDTLATSANTKRQYAYARARGDGKVYTPQAIVDGMRHVVGSRPNKIETALSATEKYRLATRVSLAVTTAPDGLSIELDGEIPPKVKAAVVSIAAVQPTVEVKIKRGENHGRSITYHNVVRKFVSVGTWSGGPKRISVNRRDLAGKPGQRCVVLVQAKGPGAVLAAAWTPDQH